MNIYRIYLYSSGRFSVEKIEAEKKNNVYIIIGIRIGEEYLEIDTLGNIQEDMANPAYTIWTDDESKIKRTKFEFN
jgi:hypothetical protein